MLWCDHGASSLEGMISRVEALLELHLLLTVQMKAVLRARGKIERQTVQDRSGTGAVMPHMPALSQRRTGGEE